MTSLKGLENLDSIVFAPFIGLSGLQINNNASLTDISSLQGLQFIAKELNVGFNPNRLY